MLRVALYAIVFFIIGCSSNAPIEIPDIDLPKKFSYNLPKNPTSKNLSDASIEQKILYLFNDIYLSKAIFTALENNQDITILYSRVKQAKIKTQIASSNRWYPKDNINATAGFGNDGANLSIGDTVSWELDLFGKIDDGKENIVVQEQNLSSLQVSLSYEIAMLYFDMLQSKYDIYNYGLILENLKNIFDMKSQKQSLGLTDMADIRNLKSSILTQENNISSKKQDMEEQKNKMLNLLGVKKFDFSKFYKNTKVNLSEPKIFSISLMPSEVILNRPDIKSQIASFNAQLNTLASVKANLYPSISIGGNLSSVISSGGSDLAYRIFTSVSAPLFNRYEIYKNIELQNEIKDEVLVQLQKSINSAFGEIQSSVYKYNASIEQEKNVLNALGALQKENQDLSTKYKNGLIDTIVLLENQNLLLQKERELFESRITKNKNAILLFKVFGGSFWKKK